MCIIIRLDETYYLKVKSDITPEFIIKQIIKNCGMRKDSFGEYYVKRILNNILSGGINLTEFYEKYYKNEYSSFIQFLYNKELIDYEDIEKLSFKDNELFVTKPFLIFIN
ncbi:MAG: hypothetical protein E6481_14425, partial [Clostridium perfringens]|nr:hypothetical protein [Clostridium perfringens]